MDLSDEVKLEMLSLVYLRRVLQHKAGFIIKFIN